MTFPTIPTTGAGTLAGLNQLNTTATLTGPDLNTLTKSPGDLLIAIAGEYQSNAGTDAAYTGWAGGGLTWTEIRDSTGTAVNRLGVAYARVVTGSETGTVTVTRSGTLVGDASMIVLVISGAHATTAPEATTMATGTTAGADPGNLSPSWGAEDTLWIGVNGNGMTSGTGSWTANNGAPTNYTDYYGTNPSDTSTIGDFGLAVAFRQLNSSTGNFTTPFTQDTSNARNSALLIAVRPAAVQPSATATLSGTGSITSTQVLGKVATVTLSGTGAITAEGSVPGSGTPATYVGSAQASVADLSGQTFTFNKHASAVTGDLVIGVFTEWYSGGAATLTLPSGATQISQRTVTAAINGGTIRTTVWAKKLAAESSFAMATSVSVWGNHAGVFFHNWDDTVTLTTLLKGGTTDPTGNTAIASTSGTFAAQNAAVWIVGNDDAGNLTHTAPTSPTGMTERVEADMLTIATKENLPSGGSISFSGGTASATTSFTIDLLYVPGTAGAVTNFNGSATLAGTGTLTVAGTTVAGSYNGTATLSGTGSITATGVVAKTATATLTGTGTISPSIYPWPTTVSGRVIQDQTGQPWFFSMYHQWNLIGWGGGRDETGAGTTTPHSAFAAVATELKANGINSILTLVITSNQGGETGPFQDGRTWDGVTPWSGGIGSFNESYWARVDDFIDTMATAGITVYMFLMSSYTIATGTAFAGMTTTQATTFGTNLANRYKNRPNIIWGFGADYFNSIPSQIQNVCTALRANGDNHLISLEFYAESSTYIESNNSAPGTVPSQVDFADVYSYNAAALEVRRAYGATTKPIVFANGHYYQGGTGDNKVMSDLLGWAFTSGSVGFFIGSEGTWQNGTGYLTAIQNDAWPNTNYPAVRSALTALTGWQNLVPASGTAFVTSSRGTDATAITSGGGGGGYDSADPQNDYLTCAVTADGKLGVLYTPVARTGMTIDTSKLVATYTVKWIDPHNGSVTSTSVAGSYSTPGNNSAGNGGWYLVFQESNVVNYNGSATLSGSGTFVNLAGGSGSTSIAGSSSITATGVVARSTTASLSGTGAITSANRTNGATSLAGTGAVSATGLVATSSGATLPATGSLTASGNVVAGSTATLSGAGVITTTQLAAMASGASLSGSGALTASGVAAVAGVAAVTGVGTVTGVGVVATSTTSSLSGTGTFTTAGTVVAGTSAFITGTGAITAAGVTAYSKTSTVSGTGSITAAGLVATTASATLSGTGSINASATGATTGTSTLTGTGSLNATGRVGVAGTASLTGATSVTSATAMATAASGSINGTSSITATGRMGIVAGATIPGIPAITASGTATVQGSGSATLSGVGTITNAGVTAYSRTAAVSGSNAITTTQQFGLQAAATLSGAGTISAAGQVAATTSASLAGTAAITSTQVASFSGATSLAGTGSITGAGGSAGLGNVNLSGIAALTATGVVAKTGAASINGAPLITLTSVVDKNAPVQLQGTMSVTTTSYLGSGTDLLVSGSGTITASGFVAQRGTSTVNGVGALVLSGQVATVSSLTINGLAVLAATGQVGFLRSQTLSGTGTLSISGIKGAQTTTLISGIGSITTTGYVSRFGTAVLNGVGTITVAAQERNVDVDLIAPGLPNVLAVTLKSNRPFTTSLGKRDITITLREE